MALIDNQPLDVWVTVLLLIVPLVAVTARAYVRLTNKTFGIDDRLMAAGAFFYIFQCTTVIGGAVAGIGLADQDITSTEEYIQAGKVIYLSLWSSASWLTCFAVVLLQHPSVLCRRFLCQTFHLIHSVAYRQHAWLQICYLRRHVCYRGCLLARMHFRSSTMQAYQLVLGQTSRNRFLHFVLSHFG